MLFQFGVLLICLFSTNEKKLLFPKVFGPQVEKPPVEKPPVRAMKRPAAGILKKPAAKVGKSQSEEPEEEGEKVTLTAAAVKDHNKFCEEAKKMSVEEFTLALNKLDGKASMRLWKAFESPRKEHGEEESYQIATKDGVGSLKKKRQLLFGWVSDGQKCMESYKTVLDTVSLKKSEGLLSQWFTKAQALNHWGQEELTERVKAGTVKARKDPEDPRYWQFKANQQFGKTEVERNKSAGMAAKDKAEKKQVLQMLQSQDLEKLTEGDFVPGLGEDEESTDEEDDLPKGLAEALSTKRSKKDKKEKKEKQEGKESNKDKWEQLSQVAEGEGAKKLGDRLMAFKTELTKDIATLEAALHSGKTGGQLPKPVMKDVEKALQEGHGALASVTKSLKAGSKKSLAAPALQTALTALKKLKSKKVLVKKALKAE